jgi:putative DNA primase/helicase
VVQAIAARRGERNKWHVGPLGQHVPPRRPTVLCGSNFLRETTNDDKDLIAFLQQCCGYMLTGDIREHALLFVYGPGGNGKSVLLNTVSGILGEYCRTAPMETFTSNRTGTRQN